MFGEEVHLIVFDQELDFVSRQPATGCDQIGSAGQGPGQGICLPPATNPSVVAGPEHSGNLPISEFGRPGVVRILRIPVQRGAERLLDRRVGVAERPRELADDRVHRDHRAAQCG